MLNKSNLIFLVLPTILILSYFVFTALSKVQKNNNFARCVSVVRMAKMTGKIVSASTPQQICQYHLK
jgi:hypothetical protein